MILSVDADGSSAEGCVLCPATVSARTPAGLLAELVAHYDDAHRITPVEHHGQHPLATCPACSAYDRELW